MEEVRSWVAFHVWVQDRSTLCFKLEILILYRAMDEIA